MLDVMRLVAAGGIFGVALMSVVKATSMRQFFVSLVATELGLWLAIPAVVVTGAGFSVTIPGVAGSLLAGAAAILFLGPGLRAWRFARIHKLKPPPQQGNVLRKRVTLSGGQVAECFWVADGVRKPLVYVVHGGGWEGGEPGECAAFLTKLARNGCTVVSGGYRLAPGHGWPAPQEDVIRGLKQVLARADEWEIDPTRTFLLGRSAGGQIASSVACTDDAPPLCGCICLYSPFDLIFAYDHGSDHDLLKSRGLLRRFLGGQPETHEDTYRSASAHLLVHDRTPPFLLIHGTRDDLVWVRQSQRFAERLQEVGVAYRYLELPWATHSFDHIAGGPGSWVTLAAIRDFVFPRVSSDKIDGGDSSGFTR